MVVSGVKPTEEKSESMKILKIKEVWTVEQNVEGGFNLMQFVLLIK